ncbi:MAG: DUF3108 domain-containing protein [Saprospiraceae bacterium]
MKIKTDKIFLSPVAAVFLFPLLLFPPQAGNIEAQPAASRPVPHAADPCNTLNTAFDTGEELVYKVYYNWGFIWVSAGEIIFRVLDDDDQYHFQVIGKTHDSYDWFFKVRDYFDTWVQKDDLLPLMSIRQLQEGKYTLYDYTTFDQFRRTCYSERGRSKETIKEHNHFDVDGCMHDMLSILYFARNIDFAGYAEDESFPIKIFVDKATWPLEVRYKGAETGKKIKGLGRFNTLRFSPQVIEGDVFPKGAELNVWVSDDANRLPLVIESPLSVGSAKAILSRYAGLRHPLVAKQEK